MFSPEEITKEVKAIFGDDVLVEIKFSVNIDGYFIEVSKKIDNEVMMVSCCISSLEELQAKDPLALLRTYIKYMHMYFMEAVHQEKESYGSNVRHERRKISGRDKGNGGPTYH